MKKFIALLLSVCMISACCSGCTQLPKSDIWDGSVATAFYAGTGSEAEPYKIVSAAELAYLAKSTNEGATYAGSFFSLECDIDLNNIEWAPIGTQESQFGGHFDGNGHTISNLKISDVTTYTATYSHGTFEVNVAGLFGICNDASICNLMLNGVEMSVKNARALETVYVGALAAKFYVNTNSTISNIKVTNASFARNSQSTESAPTGIFSNLFGGIIGHIDVKQDTATCTISKVQSDVYMNLQDENFRYMTMAGGIVASLTNRGTFECSDFVTYTTAEFIDVIQYPCRIAYAAFGEVSGDGKTKLSSAYSELKVNRAVVPLQNVEQFGLSATAMIGRTVLNMNDSQLEFNNLFGCVKRTDDQHAEPIEQLFFMAENANYTEHNCKATDVLPEDHGFDTTVWDLSDPSSPKLK